MEIDIEKLKKSKELNELLEFGIINVDKPSGYTSFDISNYVKKKLGLRKTSHFGTLDPKVTGVLPVALNRACKLTGFFIGEDKEYVGVMTLHENIALEEIEKMIKKKFLGKIIQMPPVKSAVKRQLREREIKRFDLLEKEGKNILFRVECEGGTYIRKLCDDLGKELGIGAHMAELRRVRAGIFEEKDSVKLDKLDEKDILKNIIIPAEIVSRVYPAVEMEEKSVDMVLHGCPLYHKFLTKKVKIKKGEIISVFSGEKFVGMFKVTNEEKVFARSEFVLQPVVL
jgi:H/ACA ribonucleoprotein complex subunit 4